MHATPEDGEWRGMAGVWHNGQNVAAAVGIWRTPSSPLARRSWSDVEWIGVTAGSRTGRHALRMGIPRSSLATPPPSRWTVDVATAATNGGMAAATRAVR